VLGDDAQAVDDDTERVVVKDVAAEDGGVLLKLLRGPQHVAAREMLFGKGGYVVLARVGKEAEDGGREALDVADNVALKLELAHNLLECERACVQVDLAGLLLQAECQKILDVRTQVRLRQQRCRAQVGGEAAGQEAHAMVHGLADLSQVLGVRRVFAEHFPD